MSCVLVGGWEGVRTKTYVDGWGIDGRMDDRCMLVQGWLAGWLAAWIN